MGPARSVTGSNQRPLDVQLTFDPSSFSRAAESDPLEEALHSAGHVIGLVTQQLESLWHPAEVSWHLAALTSSEASPLARLQHHLSETARWCARDTHPTAQTLSTELTAAAHQLESVRVTVARQQTLLYDLALQEPAPPTPTASPAQPPAITGPTTPAPAAPPRHGKSR